MFSRNKAAATPAAPDPVEEAAEIERAGKGRPTPKRKVSEAANKRPLVPNDRRAAAKSAREKQREMRDRQYQAMQTGDERYLPPRDKGPVKRYVREYVDARWNLGEFFLPVALVFIVFSFLTAQNQELAFLTVMTLYVIVLLTVVDGFIMWRRLRKRLLGSSATSPRARSCTRSCGRSSSAARACPSRRTRSTASSPSDDGARRRERPGPRLG